ncbi:hypothetical protein DSO57_1018880 [Entomophthora muscae]|uniref:Uncharacterized protein n=1 Tax=Entomophthora muscae TaxID=34485 RepID=A0ACC2S6C5_9FUNG|nr:hypothetical protein DSO57_1018880 [Entomophthora muscae]
MLPTRPLPATNNQTFAWPTLAPPANHQTCGSSHSVYPASHADIYLADVVFFNIGSTLQERRPQAFNNLYLGVLDHNSLFGCQMVADLFAQIVFHMNMGNQSRKDKRLPPQATTTYQPMTN